MEFTPLIDATLARAGEGETCAACGQPQPGWLERPAIPAHPWRLRGLAELEQYVATLPVETHEWVLAFFLDDHCHLLSAETIARGTISEVRVSIGHIVYRGRAVGASGFVLVHNHPSGDPTPSEADIALTVRLARISRDCELPMLTHVVVAADGMKSVGFW